MQVYWFLILNLKNPKPVCFLEIYKCKDCIRYYQKWNTNVSNLGVFVDTILGKKEGTEDSSFNFYISSKIDLFFKIFWQLKRTQNGRPNKLGFEYSIFGSVVACYRHSKMKDLVDWVHNHSRRLNHNHTIFGNWKSISRNKVYFTFWFFSRYNYFPHAIWKIATSLFRHGWTLM